jgi:N-acetylmuramoyl-L-alanine amidase
MKRLIFTISGVLLLFMIGTSHSVVASDYDTYSVKSGDSLWKISNQFKIDIKEIIKMNNLKDNILHVGQTLKIPTTTDQQLERYVVKKGDNLWSLAHKYNTTVAEIKRFNNLKKDVLQIGQIIAIQLSAEDATSTNLATRSSNEANALASSLLKFETNSQYSCDLNVNGNDNTNYPIAGTTINDQLTLFNIYNPMPVNDNQKQIVKAASTNMSTVPAINDGYTKDDYKWLATIIEAEAENQPYIGKLAVGSVVINRVQSENFPNSIKGVIFQKSKRVYQFSPVGDGRINRVVPSEDSLKAAQAALEGEDPTKGALFFYNPKTATSRWIESREVAVVIVDHTFAY